MATIEQRGDYLRNLQERYTDGGAISALYHTDGICGYSDASDLGQDYTDTFEESGKAGLLRELKRCIRMRTLGQNRILCRERLDLMRDILNGSEHQLHRTVRLQVRLVEKTRDPRNNRPRMNPRPDVPVDVSRKFVVELADGHRMEIFYHHPHERALFQEYFGNSADWLFTSGLNSTNNIDMKISLLLNDTLNLQRTNINPQLKEDFAHFRFLHHLKRLYVLVKFLNINPPASVTFEHIQYDLNLALRLGNPDFEVVLLQNLNNVITRGRAVPDLWMTHFKLQQFMNQMGFKVYVNGHMYGTQAFPYFNQAARLPDSQALQDLNRDYVNQSIYEFLLTHRGLPQPAAIDDMIRQEACHHMSRDYEAYESRINSDVNSEPTGPLTVPDTAFLTSLDENFRVLPFATKMFSLQFGIFDNATWTLMLTPGQRHRLFDGTGSVYTCYEAADEPVGVDVPRHIPNEVVEGGATPNYCQIPLKEMARFHDRLKNVRDFMYCLVTNRANFRFLDMDDADMANEEV
jgi:hypothetical protein